MQDWSTVVKQAVTCLEVRIICLNKYLDISTALHVFLELLPLEGKLVGEGKDWFVIHRHVMPGIWHRL